MQKISEKVGAIRVYFEIEYPLIIAKIPQDYSNAEDLAFRIVYGLKPYVSERFKIKNSEMVLVVISQNNKVVVACDDKMYRNHLLIYFHKPSIGYAQFYDNVEPQKIIDRLKEYVNISK